MRFNEHSNLPGDHAFLSPSQYHWINYSPEKLATRYLTNQASLQGTYLHWYAAQAIELREFQINEETTLGMYINDCIRDEMTPELVLYYSENCFGTADAIRFRDNLLKIYDLKTGVTRASEHQLEAYAAIFCLEYEVDPYSIEMDLRIYQADEVRSYEADPKYIALIMDKIVQFDRIINDLRMEEESLEA